MLLPSSCQPDGMRLRHVVDHAEHGDDRGRVDRLVAGLVVERDVAAGDGDLELEASVGQALDGFAELPHHLGVLRGAEVEAVADGDRGGAGDGDVAVRLREGELGALARVELAVAAVRIRGDGEAEPGLLVDADHAAVVGEAQRGVAADVAVVLVGDPALGCQVRAGRAGCRNWARSSAGSLARGSADGAVGLQRVDPGRVGDRALVDRAVDGDRVAGRR